MRTNVLFVGLAVVMGAIGMLHFAGAGVAQWVMLALMGLAGVLLVAIYVGIVRPIRALTAGMALVSSQDFSSRLARVGHRDADDLVEMFNRMMTCLKNERLRQHEQNSFLSLLIEASPMGIVIFDFDNRISLMNRAAARLMEIDGAERFVGKELKDVPGETARLMDSVGQGETKTLRPADTRIYRCARLQFMEMGFARPFILIESLTEEVHRAEKTAYEKVIRMISHEVNNSMAGIKSLLETLAETMSGDEMMGELIESCHERCVGMSRFITQYADVVKLPEPELAECGLEGIVRRQLPFLEAMLPEGVRLSFEAHGGEEMVKVDAAQLEQVMVNVVKNGVESIAGGGKGGEIRIEVDGRRLTVSDDGPGIAPEVAAHLFTPFYTTKSSGQGIGLLCSSEILRRHGCRFSLATEGGWTRFRIEFG